MCALMHGDGSNGGRSRLARIPGLNSGAAPSPASNDRLCALMHGDGCQLYARVEGTSCAHSCMEMAAMGGVGIRADD